ncbi:dedicator of cytokinesis protein 1 isoform X2 [Daktulosphaira vitifoliae]|uniref:dedicator of cytokinesis protein 1 isoform X2 n=1 Tax=Daktulosphaira vitifoliae TaxID=58002 RepID=UPI0021A981C9|nr:dedicator of cytokinesis protein 1 isoform X2 [Daktulosphaira vitifoliae]
MTINNWTHVGEKRRYGIAIHNYLQSGPHRIKLLVGECVHVLEECTDWYYGFTFKNKSTHGIFPKKFVHIMDNVVEKFGPAELTVLKQPQIVHELTSVVREWAIIWKQLYICNNLNFKNVENKIYELVKFRSKILSGTLPIDELKEVQRLATSTIDVGNKLLGLDMVVRDEQGNILNPLHTPTIQLYKHHETATNRIQNASTASNIKKSSETVNYIYNYTVYFSLHNFMCKMTDDAELLLSLYDAKNAKSISENFVVKWVSNKVDQGGWSQNDIFHNFKALFTDLGTRDLAREKVYLVCYIVRIGGMESDSNTKKSLMTSQIRRPWGVAALDLTLYFTRKLESDEDKHHFMPFLPCEKDNLENTLKRYLNLKDYSHKDHKGQGLHVSFKLLNGDIKQVREEYPHLVLGNVSLIRKMGFPEVILPGDVRNDLYLMLVGGEFSRGSMSSDKNIQVTITACNEKGVKLLGVIFLGGESESISEFNSVVYYHEDKPRWFEIVKLAIPIEDFKGSHLKFTFKHRSSNEAKDKNEKPFALSFVKLMQDNGTTLRDTLHELLVYKIDYKKFDPTDIAYLTLASRKNELVDTNNRISVPGLSLANKDVFIIHTNICSTKLTQNVDLLSLLNWASHPDKLKESLNALMKVDGEEIVKFLQDVLDALFNILMHNSDSDLFDNMVFDCLLYIIGLVSDRKYQHFQPVLDLYIQESFCATLAYNKLIVVLKCYLSHWESTDKDLLLNIMKSFKYIMKFIARSRFLFSQLYEGKGQQTFEASMYEMLKLISNLMCINTDSTLLLQGACLKYLPHSIPDIIIVFSCTQLSSLLVELIGNVPPSRLVKQKLMTMNDIVHSKLFFNADCRAILLPSVLAKIKELLESSDEAKTSIEYRNKSKSVAKIAKVLGASGRNLLDSHDISDQVEMCVKLLGDIMDLLYAADPVSTFRDITEIMLTVLRTVIQTTIAMDREGSLLGYLVSIMIAALRQMSAEHFDIYIKHFPTRIDLLDFLMEILLVFKDLVSRPVFPPDWCEMIMLQNSVILKSLRYFSHTIRDYFFKDFEHQAWNNFFHCAIIFLTQPSLQLEKFSSNKRWRIISRYKDMRRETGFEIRSMWFNLGQYKVQFVPNLVGLFLEMTLIPEIELRKATIPIFFDMMQCEFYSCFDGHTNKRDSSNIKAKFNEFENEMIAKLDYLVEGGKGDEQFKELFKSIMLMQCENHSTMKEQGIRFVKIVTCLMERLLEYRAVVDDENKENRMNCTVNLLNFYMDIKRQEIYIRYVNKLCALHLDCDDFAEAAYTLRLHSELLSWSNDSLPPLLRSPLRYPTCDTHRQLKEALYHDIIDYFDKGKMWECAVSMCKELVRQCECETYDYIQLSSLLHRMSNFYDNIIKQLRPEPEYFRVAYYGKGFPSFLQNKIYVYRGKEYEFLSDFSTRIRHLFPNATLMQTLSKPGSDIMESTSQYLQINSVEPVMDERKEHLLKKPINEQILRHYRVNDVKKFKFSRPFYRIDPKMESNNDNEFANLWIERTVMDTTSSLPGILRWFPVKHSESYEISPLENAIETMQEANRELRELIITHRNDASLPLHPLSMKLTGILDAAVMGGVTKYEKAFFSTEYFENHMEDELLIQQLKDLVALQIPLLEIGVKVHGARADPNLTPLQLRLEDCFAKMKMHIENKYGKKTCDIKFDNIKIRRHTTTGNNINEKRYSGSSIGSTEGQNGTTNSKSSLIATTSLSSSLAIFAGPVLVSGSNKFGTIGALSRKDKKEKKRRNRTVSKMTISNDRDSSISNTSTSTSQWYTMSDNDNMSISSINSTLSAFSSPAPVIELRQELTPKRPLRSEVEKEKRLSRPNSGQFQYSKLPSMNSLNRDSLVTTDSTASDDDVPPPLPRKARETDYSNLSDKDNLAMSDYSSPIIINNIPLVNSEDDIRPPTPPPKKPQLKSSI